MLNFFALVALDEFGLYRASGLSSDVKRLKNAFNKGKQVLTFAWLKSTSVAYPLTYLLLILPRVILEEYCADFQITNYKTHHM